MQALSAIPRRFIVRFVFLSNERLLVGEEAERVGNAMWNHALPPDRFSVESGFKSHRDALFALDAIKDEIGDMVLEIGAVVVGGLIPLPRYSTSTSTGHLAMDEAIERGEIRIGKMGDKL